MRITATESVTITRSHVRHVMRAAAKPVQAPAHDTAAIMRHVDNRMRQVETSRRNDLLVALPAALAPIVPFLGLPAGAGTAATAFLASPVVVKILRRF